MAESFLGDVTQQIGNTVGGMIPPGIGEAVGNAVGHTLSDLQVDVSGLMHGTTEQIINALHDVEAVPAADGADKGLEHPIVEAHKEGAPDSVNWQQQMSPDATPNVVAYAHAGDENHAGDAPQDAHDHAVAAADSGSHGGATTHDASHDAATDTDGSAAA